MQLPPKARLLYVCVVGAGIVAGVHCFRAVWAQNDFGWLLLALFSLCSSLFPVRFPGASGSLTRRAGEPGSHAVALGSIADYFIIFSWLAFSPEVAFWIGLINAAQLSLRSLHRRTLYRLWYNLSGHAVPALVAASIFYRIHGHPAPFRFEDAGSLPAALLNLYLGALVFFWSNTILVAMAISLSSKTPFLPDLAQRMTWMFGAIASATAAGVSYYAFPDSPILVGLAGVPAFFLIQSFLLMDQRRIKLLAASGRFLQGSLDALSSAIGVLDSSGRIVATNQVWRANRLRDRPFGEWLGIGDDYLAACRANFDRIDSSEAIATGIGEVLAGRRKSFALEYGGPPPSNCWHELRVSGFGGAGHPRVVIAHQDITQRVRAADRLRESEAKYRRFFENDLTGDFVADGSGRLVDCNPAFARMFGFQTPEQALRAKLSSLFTNRAGARALLEILRKETKVEYFQTDIRRLDGGTLSVVSNFTAQRDESGQLAGIRGYLFDDTRRKKLEEDLIQAQKMEAVGRLAGGMAHEFNNMLTVIGGYAEFLVTELKPHRELRTEAELILQAVKKGAGLTEQLLVFTPRRTPPPEPVALDAVVEDNAAMLRRLVGDRVRLKLSLKAGCATVRVHPARLEQVLLNLALNARDAMPEGGLLRMETRLARPDQALLRVVDSGGGISEADRERVFEPFFTTKARGRGTGLGLATVQGIIRQSGGSIEVFSRPGRGTRFEIRLPAATEPQARPAPPPDRPGSARGSETVLVVEDERAIRDLICNTLQRLGYRVLRACDGVEAVALLESAADPVDLLLTDLVMPRMGGWELVQRLRDTDRAPTRILCVSGYPETRGDPTQSGEPRVQYLPKPFTPSQLASKVRQTLDA